MHPPQSAVHPRKTLMLSLLSFNPIIIIVICIIVIIVTRWDIFICAEHSVKHVIKPPARAILLVAVIAVGARIQLAHLLRAAAVRAIAVPTRFVHRLFKGDPCGGLRGSPSVLRRRRLPRSAASGRPALPGERAYDWIQKHMVGELGDEAGGLGGEQLAISNN